jgi:hypothetical protein
LDPVRDRSALEKSTEQLNKALDKVRSARRSADALEVKNGRTTGQ